MRNIRMPPPALTAILAVFCGTLMDATVKYVDLSMDLITMVFWRFAIATVIVAIPFFASGRRLPGWEATRFHAMRGLFHVIAAFLFFFALSKLELAEVTTLGFTAALLIIPTAWILLGERMSPIAFVAGVLGLVGVLTTFYGADFEAELTPDRWIGFASVMVSACLYAVSIVLLRKRAAQDGGFAIAVYANLFPALYMAVPALLFGEPAQLTDIPELLFMGFLGMMVWVLMTSAYARAPAQKLAPMEYTALIWSALIGWAVFGEVPGPMLWAGAAIIILACLLVSWRDGRISVARGRNSTPLIPDAMKNDNPAP